MAAKLPQINVRQQRFVAGLCKGMPAGRAYEAAGYAAKGAEADTLASRLSRNVKVAAHVNAMRKAATEKAQFTLDDAVQFLVDAISTPVGEIDEKNRLCQEFTRDQVGEGTIRTKVKTPDKLRALEMLAKLTPNGWFAPERHEVKLSDLDQVVASISNDE